MPLGVSSYTTLILSGQSSTFMTSFNLNYQPNISVPKYVISLGVRAST